MKQKSISYKYPILMPTVKKCLLLNTRLAEVKILAKVKVVHDTRFHISIGCIATLTVTSQEFLSNSTILTISLGCCELVIAQSATN